MSPAELERFLYARIPLSKAMEAEVVSIGSNTLVLQAPLAPNTNYRDTVFGGSASALAILAAWSLLHVRLCQEGYDTRLVIQRNSMEYDRPIAGEFTARASLESAESWPRFTHTLARRGKARIGVNAVLKYNGETAGRLHGEFVALNEQVQSAT